MIRLRTVVAIGAVLVVAGCGFDFGEDEGAASIEPDPKFVEAGTLTVCTSIPYEPFEFTQDGKPVGFDIDLANEVAKRLDRRPEIVSRDFETIQSGQVLNDGTCDVAVAALTISGDRARVMDFSSPYFNAGQAMVVRDGSGITTLEDLSGLTIGVQGGSTGELYVTDNAPPDAEIVPLKDPAQLEAALSDGQVDAAILDYTIVGDVISRNPDFEAPRRFDTGEQYGMAVKKNSNVDLLRIINEVLADLQAGPGYDAIYNKWFRGAASNQ
jgi:polar amino acid transport system substrate-binding protein